MNNYLYVDILLFVSWILIACTGSGNGQDTVSTDTLSLCSNSSAFQGMCYVTFDDPMTYSDAITQCNSIGGSLVKLDPVDQVTHIIQAIGGTHTTLWIGLDDIAEAGVYRWVIDNSSLNPNQLRFRSANNDDLDCVGLDPAGNLQFANCNDSNVATCNVGRCYRPNNDEKCECYREKFSEEEAAVTQLGDGCILTVFKQRNTFQQQGISCGNIGNSGVGGGQLVQLKPWQETKNIVMQQISAMPAQTLTWVGLSDISEEGHVRFTGDGSVSSSDSNASNDRVLNCVVINPISGLWEYAECSEKVPVVCQTTECPVMASPSPYSTNSVTTNTEVTEGTGTFSAMIVGPVASSILAITIIAVVIVFLCCVLRSSKCLTRSNGKHVDIPMSHGGDHNFNITGTPSRVDITPPSGTPTLHADIQAPVVFPWNRRVRSDNSHHYCGEGNSVEDENVDERKQDRNQLVDEYEDIESVNDHIDIGAPMAAHRKRRDFSENNQHHCEGGKFIKDDNEDGPRLVHEYEDVEAVNALSGANHLTIHQISLGSHGSKPTQPWSKLSPRTDMTWSKLLVPGAKSREVKVDAENTDNVHRYPHPPTKDGVYYYVDQPVSSRPPIYDDASNNGNRTERSETGMVYNELYDGNEVEVVYSSVYDGMDSM